MHFIYLVNLQIYITSLCMFQVIYIITQCGATDMFHQVTYCMLMRMREADVSGGVHVELSFLVLEPQHSEQQQSPSGGGCSLYIHQAG